MKRMQWAGLQGGKQLNMAAGGDSKLKRVTQKGTWLLNLSCQPFTCSVSRIISAKISLHSAKDGADTVICFSCIMLLILWINVNVLLALLMFFTFTLSCAVFIFHSKLKAGRKYRYKVDTNSQLLAQFQKVNMKWKIHFLSSYCVSWLSLFY